MQRPIFIITIPGFASNEQDTTCIPASQVLVKTINTQFPEVEVIVITLDYPPHTVPYEWFGNKIIPLNGSRYFFRPFLWMRLYRLLKKITSRKNVKGILNLWCADNALVSHYFSKWNNIENYTWLRGQDARKGNRILLFFKPHKDRLIALSDALREEFFKNYGILAAHVIYPGIVTDMFSLPGHPGKELDIIGVGSLIQLKRYDVFIDIVEKLKAHHPYIKAMILGNGPEYSSLSQQIIQKGLQENITLYGQAAHPVIPSLMASAKILLHPSSYEGYAGVCLEGLAAGCHVVSFISPEKKAVTHWHIVHDQQEMELKCLEIMELPGHEFTPVIHHTNIECVHSLMSLYR